MDEATLALGWGSSTKLHGENSNITHGNFPSEPKDSRNELYWHESKTKVAEEEDRYERACSGVRLDEPRKLMKLELISLF